MFELWHQVKRDWLNGPNFKEKIWNVILNRNWTRSNRSASALLKAFFIFSCSPSLLPSLHFLVQLSINNYKLDIYKAYSLHNLLEYIIIDPISWNRYSKTCFIYLTLFQHAVSVHLHWSHVCDTGIRWIHYKKIWTASGTNDRMWSSFTKGNSIRSSIKADITTFVASEALLHRIAHYYISETI